MYYVQYFGDDNVRVLVEVCNTTQQVVSTRVEYMSGTYWEDYLRLEYIGGKPCVLNQRFLNNTNGYKTNMFIGFAIGVAFEVHGTTFQPSPDWDKL